MRNRQRRSIGLGIAFRPPRHAEILPSASPMADEQRPPPAKDSVRQRGRHARSPAGYRTWLQDFREVAQIRIPRALRTNATRLLIGPRLENRLRRHIAEHGVR